MMHHPWLKSQPANDQNVESMHGDHVIPKTSSVHACSDLGNSNERDSTIIEIGGDHEGYHQTIRRSVSMNDRQNHRVLVADILSRNDEEDKEDDMNSESDDIVEGVGKSSHRKWVLLHCVMSSVAMKRSFSSARFFPTRPSRARNTVLPV
ncbi:unnamed protein product [Prunus armeniaca]|uniref:Uncharacterized protein n=1 Tax=Prunus armeniaca TaxID=36596 RepID=A0A6J5XCH6_PRUAR|nr:unnamed protein product [Prunus armeniaca]CAB4309625.1 unnamed protein product [Prunus armeniaca]